MGKAIYCDTSNISDFRCFWWQFEQAQLDQQFSKTKLGLTNGSTKQLTAGKVVYLNNIWLGKPFNQTIYGSTLENNTLEPIE